MRYHACPYRIQFNLTLASQQIDFILHQTGAETSFPERSTTAIGAIYILHITLTQCFQQQCRRLDPVSRNHKMHMIGHQYIGMNLATGLTGLFGQSVQIDRIIFVGKETGLAIVAMLPDM